jgi:hypothetical protein
MAIYNSIALGNSTQSIGNVTLLKLKGQNIAKAKITATTNRKTPSQVVSRSRLTNAVSLWPYFETILQNSSALTRKTESLFNVYVRLFKNSMLPQVNPDLNAIFAAIPDGDYGAGYPIKITSATVGADGLTIVMERNSLIVPANSHIVATLYDAAKSKLVFFTTVIGGQTSKTIVVPDVTGIGQNIAFANVQIISSDYKSCGPVQVITGKIG